MSAPHPGSTAPTSPAQAGSNQRLSAADLERRIRDRMPIQALSIEDDSHKHAGHAGAQGGAAHFSIRLISERFIGLTRVARHRLVYDAVSDWMPDRLHALAIDARSPTE